MHILITGGAGFLGLRLASALLARGTLAGKSITQLVLVDLAAPTGPASAAMCADPRVAIEVGDLSSRLATLFAGTDTALFDAVFHLASAVSADCEADFDLGLRANLDATRALLDACRDQSARTGVAPLFFFSSSVAVYGSDPALALPPTIDDRTLPTPQSSYGCQKFVCELLIADYTRKGYVDGRAARLMTVSVRPGRPNGAASSFLSGIVREPLGGQPAVCPVDPSTEVALSSPAATIAGILAVAEAPRALFGGRTAINLPALTVSVQQMLDALAAVGGATALALVQFKPDHAIARMVGGWPARFSSRRAGALALPAETDYADVILQYVQDYGAAVTNEQAKAQAHAQAQALARPPAGG